MRLLPDERIPRDASYTSCNVSIQQTHDPGSQLWPDAESAGEFLSCKIPELKELYLRSFYSMAFFSVALHEAITMR